MAIEVPIVEGWTGQLDLQLLADAVAADLTGMTVTLVIKDKGGNSVTPGGTVTVVDAANGKVRYSPVSNDFFVAKSPYSVRWKVVDGSNKTVFFPSGKADQWVVYPQ